MDEGVPFSFLGTITVTSFVAMDVVNVDECTLKVFTELANATGTILGTLSMEDPLLGDLVSLSATAAPAFGQELWPCVHQGGI